MRVRQPDTLARREISGLLKRAVAAIDYPRAIPLELAAFLKSNVGRSDVGLFVAAEDNAPRAVVVALLPNSPFMIAPQIVLAYSEGSRALARKVGARLRQWILDNGFTDALAINLRHPEAVFGRVFGHFGKPERLASLVSFRLR